MRVNKSLKKNISGRSIPQDADFYRQNLLPVVVPVPLTGYRLKQQETHGQKT